MQSISLSLFRIALQLSVALLLLAVGVFSTGCIKRHAGFPGAVDGGGADRAVTDVAAELEVGLEELAVDPGLPEIPDLQEESSPEVIDVADAESVDVADTLDLAEAEAEVEIAPWCGDGSCAGEEDCGTCPDDCGCEDGKMCSDGVCICEPDCEGKECGSDACDGDCGTCAGAQDACQEGKCVCQPDCAGKECGPDGCGGLCDVDECDDGNPCTEDECVESQCVNELLPLEEMEVEAWKCICEFNAHCAELNDDDLCNGELHCAESTEDPDVKVCQVAPDSVPDCDNGNYCDGPEGCDPATGDCLPGVPPAVDDFNDCTVDSCDPLLGELVHLPDHEYCDDGEFCTGEELCDVAAGCLPGTPPALDDEIDCTEDECDEELDVVLNTPDNALCDDGNLCNGAELCAEATGCLEGAPPDVDDQVDCTVDWCDVDLNEIVHQLDHDFCDDKQFCNGVETCDAAADCLQGTPPDTDDLVDCTDDTCDDVLDIVVHAPNHGLCDDEDDCTFNVCDADLDCIFPDVPDGSQCDGDSPLAYCLSGTCECVPNCEDRQCGPDGCGGSCGDCFIEDGPELVCNDAYGVCHRPGWVAIPGGKFMMGSPTDEPCREYYEGPRHPVSITRDLLVSDHELTYAEWDEVVPPGTPNPSYFGPDGVLNACEFDHCPIEMINWFEALTVANLMSEREGLEKCYVLNGPSGTLGGGCGGLDACNETDYTWSTVVFKGLDCPGYRLPTEAEWEYFARAGTDTAFPFPPPEGSDSSADCDLCDKDEVLGDYAWYCDNSFDFTHPTAEKLPNAWGLYDTSGNVVEWCWDYFTASSYWTYYGEDPANSHPGGTGVARGGSFVYYHGSQDLRSAQRGAPPRDGRSRIFGVRLVRTLSTTNCTPDCEGKECGPDGCGGSCGGCLEAICDDEYGVCKKDGWVVVPSGSFIMGSPADQECFLNPEGPLHPVTISRPMLVSDHEVTQGEWAETTGTDPSYYGATGPLPDPPCGAADCPVEQVNWYEAVTYCNLLSEKEGLDPCYELTACADDFGAGCGDELSCNAYTCEEVEFLGLECEGYRLPTEAEWEYMARAGTSKAFYYPPPDGSDMADEATCQACYVEPALEETAWYCNNSAGVTHPVRELTPNEWGLYDMAGNVAEWCWDLFDEEYYSSSSVIDPLGGTGPYRAVRAGGKGHAPDICRATYRGSYPPLVRHSYLGLRVVRSIQGSCSPHCENRQCGSDGCGGSCGECGEGEECIEEFGACRPADWVVISGGTFIMGTPDDEPCRENDEGPQHQVTITRPMLVSDHPVIRSEWEAVTGLPDPSYNGPADTNNCKSQDCPVERINWYEAMAYCNALSLQEGLETCYVLEQCTYNLGSGCPPGNPGCACDECYECGVVEFKGVDCAGYRMPTEAEWEYLARGGIAASLPFPPPFGGGKSNECFWTGGDKTPEPNMEDHVWYLYTTKDQMQPTWTNSPNNFGLYDTLGNVGVWVTDPHPNDIYPDESVVDPVAQADPAWPGSTKYRGCAYNGHPSYCRPGSRLYKPGSAKNSDVGLRVLRSLLCRDGETRQCGVDEGACSSGVQTCVNGVWGDCLDAAEPDPDPCAGYECGGDNGCGGDCGTCPEGWDCDEDHHVCVRPQWVVVPGGDFMMGSPEDEPCRGDDEGLPRNVTISRDMLVSDHEVTSVEWQTVVGEFDPSEHVELGVCLEPDCPVERVSWYDALTYCNWLSELEGLEPCYDLGECSGAFAGGCEEGQQSCTGDYACPQISFAGLDCQGYRLPTEAEWEYLARAGTTTAYAYPPPAGSEVVPNPDGCYDDGFYEDPNLDGYAWYNANSGGPVHPVRELDPNAFGLYDMTGNTQEICWDAFQEDYTTLGDLDPLAEDPGGYRVGRGCGTTAYSEQCRSADRQGADHVQFRSRDRGFRVVRTIE